MPVISVPTEQKSSLQRTKKDFPDGSMGKESSCNAGDTKDVGLIPDLGRSPIEGNSNSLHYSCLRYPMDRGAWWTTAQRVAKCWTWLSTHKDKKGSKSSRGRMSELVVEDFINYYKYVQGLKGKDDHNEWTIINRQMKTM